MGFSVKDFASPQVAAKRPPAESAAQSPAGSPLRPRTISAVRRPAGWKRLFLAALSGWLCLAGLTALYPCSAGVVTIILDPGHGGGDVGAGGSGGFTEKQFTLSLAQKIALHLEEHFRIELTRSGDVEMAPADRAAKANYLRADLMVSLHAAVAPYCGVGTAAVYYHSDERLSLPYEMRMSDPLVAPADDPPAWVRLQARHRHRSEQVAGVIKRVLEHGETFDNVMLSAVPLAALMGADLPAVLIEVGCFHAVAAPPAERLEKQLEVYAAALAAAVASAIDELVP